jgi:hypothetical protein
VGFLTEDHSLEGAMWGSERVPKLPGYQELHAKASGQIKACCLPQTLTRAGDLTLDMSFWSGGRKCKQINGKMSR